MGVILVKPENLKIVTVSFVIFSFLLAYVAKVIFETLSVAVGFFAAYYSMDAFRHGVPIVTGLIIFSLLQFKDSYRTLADEVVTEVRKVVWPTKKELYSMTTVVCIILIISGLVLGLFDLVAGTGVRFFME